MQTVKTFDRGGIFREINARRREINRTMIYNREVNKPPDPSLSAELVMLANREDELLLVRSERPTQLN
jgi:hypothetical protein